MRVLIVSANTEPLNMPALPLGAALVAAAARRAGHDVAFLDLMFRGDPAEDVRRAIAEARPKVIGISVRNIDDQNRDAPRFLLEDVRRTVDACRAHSTAPIVLGGAGYSIFPDEALAYLDADFGVAGDGEAVFPRLLETLSAGADPSGLPGVHARGRPAAVEPERPRELDAFPPVDDELWASADPSREDLWIPVQSRRGCANDCSYCSTGRIQGRTVRARSPALVAEAVARAMRAGFSRFYFVDNSFNLPAAHAFELCRRLGELPQRPMWRCILYPQDVPERLVEAMAAAGCAEVALGFESGAAEVLREMNKRYSPEEVARVAGLLRRHGIRCMGFLLLGGPGETRDTVERSLAFADSLDLDLLRTTVGIRVYPGTPLARRAVAEGLVPAGEDLLRPRFYLAPGLEEWLRERVVPGVRVRGRP